MTEPAAASDERPPRRLTPFLPTRQHRRFVEFADAVRRHRYIGACYGAPGIGKTLSARTYAAADDYDQWAGDRFTRGAVLPPALLASRTAMLTPGVTTTARELETQIYTRCGALGADIARTLRPDVSPELSPASPLGTELLIVDEADRLKTNGLELVRDYLPQQRRRSRPDRDARLRTATRPLPPALQPRRLRPPLYRHPPRPVPVLAAARHDLRPERPTDVESVVTIVRITGGNFRLVERLMNQVARIMTINNLDTINLLDTITPDAIEAAREVLVVGG